MNKREVPLSENLGHGHLACAGCGAAVGMRLTLKALGEKTVMVFPASCWSIIPGFWPYSSFRIPVVHAGFVTGGATASGVRAALDIRGDHEAVVAVVVVASILGQMLQPDFVFDATEAFMATVYLNQLLSHHVLGETAAGPIVDYFSQVWRDIFAKRAFSVRNPTTSGPQILSAHLKGAGNRAKLANLVLASESAVRANLSDELRADIRATANPKRTRLEDLQPLSPPSPRE